jgi:hypothetical protein
MKTDHWICQACRKPCEHRGIIAVYNANSELGRVGNYPIDASPDVDPRTTTDAYRIETDPSVATLREITHAQVEGARWLIRRPLNIDFGIFHPECNPFSEQSAYTFGAPIRLEGWASWVLHLQEKTWMGRWDLMRMLDFWWSHKGEDPPDL